MDREYKQEMIIRKMYDFAKRAVLDFAEIEAMTLPRNMSVDGKNYYNLPQFKEIMKGLDSEISGLGEDEVKLYANPDYPSTLMSYMRTSITKENARYFSTYLSNLSKENDIGFQLDKFNRIIAFCTIAQINQIDNDNEYLFMYTRFLKETEMIADYTFLNSDEMIEDYIKFMRPLKSLFSVRADDMKRYYINISGKTGNELVDAFEKLDDPFVDMDMYGREIFAGEYSQIKEGERLVFSLEFDMDEDKITLFTDEKSYDLPMPLDAKYKEDRTKADTRLKKADYKINKKSIIPAGNKMETDTDADNIIWLELPVTEEYASDLLEKLGIIAKLSSDYYVAWENKLCLEFSTEENEIYLVGNDVVYEQTETGYKVVYQNNIN